jgi:hypothetical protein
LYADTYYEQDTHSSVHQKGVWLVRKKWCVWLILGILLMLPATAAASPFKIGFTITRPDEGIVFSELIYNDQVLWRVQLLSDGAKPAASVGGGPTTIVIPEILNGFFVVRVNKG